MSSERPAGIADWQDYLNLPAVGKPMTSSATEMKQRAEPEQEAIR